MKRHWGSIGAGIAGAILLLGTAEAGWVIQSEFRARGMDPSKETDWFQKDRIRSDGEGQSTIMDFSSRRIIWIDGKRRKYSVMSFDEFRKAMRESIRQANAAVEEMKKMGVEVPGMPAQRPRGKVTVTKGSGATVAGYACDGYRVSVGGKPTEEIWVTRKVDMSSEMSARIMKEFEDLNSEVKKAGAGFSPEPDDPEYAKIHDSGYPMRVVDKVSGSVQEVTRAERKQISADTFGEPDGYAKVPFRELFDFPREEAGTVKGEGKKRTKTAEPAAEAAEAPSAEGGQSPSSAAGRKAADYGKRSAEEATDAAKEGATQPFEEKKSEGLDAIKEGVSGGIKKLFKW